MWCVITSSSIFYGMWTNRSNKQGFKVYAINTIGNAKIEKKVCRSTPHNRIKFIKNMYSLVLT